MSERVTMPALGESVTEGTVTRWLKSVGDSVEVDEPLLEVSTDKVDTEIPSPVAGTLQEILVGEDDTVPVGADLAVIGYGASAQGSDSGDSGSSEGESSAQEPAGADSSEADSADTDGDAIEDPSDAGAVAEAGDEGGQDPAQPHPGGSNDSAGGQGQEGSTVTMPALGESVTEGTVTRWLKSVGDEVAVDEALMEVSTDKVDTEIPSPVAGTVTKILVQEDETVPVGADLAIIGGSDSASDASDGPAEDKSAAGDASADSSSTPTPQQQEQPEAPSTEAPAPGEAKAEESTSEPEAQPEPQQSSTADQSQPAEKESASAASAPAASAPAASAPAASAPAPSASSASASSDSDAAAYVTPLVRKLASDAGIDLASLKGTGIGGRIRKQDVVAAIEAAKAPAPPQAPASASSTAPTSSSAPAAASSASEGLRGTTQKMSRLRKMIATRMVESLQTSAQLTTVVEVDVTKVSRLRDRVKGDFAAREGTKLSFLPFFALAAVEALKAYPSVNASIDGDSVVYHGGEHLGVAVDTEKGLIVPVVKNAGDLNIAGLARAIADVADRTRRNKITPDDLSGGTFTITNTGSRGALFDTPIINQPQVAILGTGSVVKRPIVVTDADGGETIAIRSMVYLALTYDHRIVDGADAARFLTAVKDRLEDGSFEV